MKSLDTRLSRRGLLKASAGLGVAVGAAGVLGMPRIARASGTTRLTFGHGAAPGNPRAVAAEKFAELVNKRSNGEIEVTVAGSSQLGDDVAMITSLRTGLLAISANSQGPTAAVVPELAAFGLPYLFPDARAALDTIHGPLGQRVADKMKAVGLISLDWWDNGIRDITNSKHPIAKPADLDGLKIRTPADAVTIDIFKALGAATQQISFAELYVALQQGVVDGQENPLTNIASAKLYEVNPYISLSHHKWESTPVMMSKIYWDRLGADQQKLIRDAMAEAGKLQVDTSIKAGDELLRQFRQNDRVKVNDIDRPAFVKATASVRDAWEKKPFGDFVKALRSKAGA